MPDKSSLRMLGLVFAGLTAAVIVTAAWLVNATVSGKLALKPAQSVSELSAISARR
jgi:hypothetical protein